MASEAQTSLAEHVRAAGIVGAGGAGFPTHVKLMARADTVIANGAECEPLLRCDKAVMRTRTPLVLEGLTHLAEATGAGRAVIALKGHYKDTIAAVRAVAARDFPSVEVFELGNFYPAGDEQVLVHDVTSRVVPEGGIPIQVGVVVSNVVSLTQIAEAVSHGRPVTRRALTVAGAVQRSLTCELPIGAPMRLGIQLAGGATVDRPVIIEGGPMMGRLVRDLDEPVTKRTSGIVVLAEDHPLVLQKAHTTAREILLGHAVCCQCRMCTDLCPRFLLGHELHPNLVMRALTSEGLAHPPPAHVTAAYICCLCGVCEIACPLWLSPRRVFDEMRLQLRRAGVDNPHRRKECTPHPDQRSRRVPIPRLVAKLGLEPYAHAPDEVDWTRVTAPRVRILLSQHTGAPARPVVAVGQRVSEGDLVGEIPEGQLGTRIHASITGVVTAAGPRAIEIEQQSALHRGEQGELTEVSR